MAAIADVDNKIESKKVMVFSKSGCPFCTMAKQTFSTLISKGELSTDDYEVEEIENRPDCSDIQDYLSKKTGARSVPRVFINGKCIGGGSEVKAMYSSGELVKLLKVKA